MMDPLSWPGLDQWLARALAEDIGSGDVTTEAVVPPETHAALVFTAKSELVACGLAVAERAFRLLDPAAKTEFRKEEGAEARAGDPLLKIQGKARALLCAERVALNIVQHLSGIAALTRAFVRAVEGTGARIAATRKTTPLNRRLEKYAVVIGGGEPHRFGLDDGVLIKDNHIAVAGSVREAVRRARSAHHLLKIEVEVESLAQAEEAVAAGAEALLLDNMSLEEMKAVVEKFKDRVLLEASGNITLENAAEVAAAGVDIISVGALTHSARAADISAKLELR